MNSALVDIHLHIEQCAAAFTLILMIKNEHTNIIFYF